MKPPNAIPDWNGKLLTGIEEIDFQHKFFLKLISRFYGMVSNDMAAERVRNHIREISLYAQFHFQSEENLMEMIGYPDLDTHRDLHVRLIEQVSNKVNLFAAGAVTVQEITSFLIGWFIEHTIGEDQKIGTYYERMKEKP